MRKSVRQQGRRRPDAAALVVASRELCDAVESLRFSPPVAFVYNPLRYARAAHEEYLRRFGEPPKRLLLVGMNPGPWGMAQTGVPFGDVETVRDWLGIRAPVEAPERAHPSRPVLGLDCPRVEVSGRRLWGLLRGRYGDPERLFREAFVANYCPLLFLEAGGRNLTPDRLPAAERRPLLEACDRHLAALAAILRPALLVGVGRFAASRIEAVVASSGLDGVRVASILHPSPASPRANAGWARLATSALVSCGAWRP